MLGSFAGCHHHPTIYTLDWSFFFFFIVNSPICATEDWRVFSRSFNYIIIICCSRLVLQRLAWILRMWGEQNVMQERIKSREKIIIIMRVIQKCTSHTNELVRMQAYCDSFCSRAHVYCIHSRIATRHFGLTCCARGCKWGNRRRHNCIREYK